jgi:hypothetical protein
LTSAGDKTVISEKATKFKSKRQSMKGHAAKKEVIQLT